jgi:predicted metal-binding membrane protein
VTARSSPATAPGRLDGAPRDRAFFAAAALLFGISAWVTLRWCGGMSGGMHMPGGWIMSMTWMLMPGQTWPGAAGSFLGMWTVMMVAMMTPSLVPPLLGYRRSMRARGQSHLAGPTAIAGAGYFFVWASLGAIAFPIGFAISAAEMRSAALSRAVPIATGVALLVAGGFQLGAWKSRQLRGCRDASACEDRPAPDAGSAWRHGVGLGLRCGLCCAGYTLALLVTGVMNVAGMAMIAAAITAERIAPRPGLVARVAGAALLAAGALAIARALRVV